MKLYEYSRGRTEPCYYCGAPCTSGEHAPPEMMFKGFGCNFIIVPSCDEHNSKKSGNDLAIVAAYIEAINGMLQDATITDSELPRDVQKAVKRARGKKWFENAKNKVDLHPYIIDGIMLPRFASDFNISDWMRQLTAALVWNATGYYDAEIGWDKKDKNEPFTWSAQHSLGSKSETEEIRLSFRNWQIERYCDSLPWLRGWASYAADIYNFQMTFLSNPQEWQGREVMFKHQFYRTYDWYVGFSTSSKTKQLLKQLC